jgi:hypothetical protein
VLLLASDESSFISGAEIARLAAILAADVAGYSRLMGADEEGTLERLKAHRRQLIDPKITECRGRIDAKLGIAYGLVTNIAVGWSMRTASTTLGNSTSAPSTAMRISPRTSASPSGSGSTSATSSKQIGRELGVRYVIEGSVRRAGDQVQANVQLIDAESSTHLWAERFDTDRHNLAEAQSEITGRLVRRGRSRPQPPENAVQHRRSSTRFTPSPRRARGNGPAAPMSSRAKPTLSTAGASTPTSGTRR